MIDPALNAIKNERFVHVLIAERKCAMFVGHTNILIFAKSG